MAKHYNLTTEQEIQEFVVNYLNIKYPKTRYCASLGGHFQKSIKQKIKNRKAGYVKGFPDLQITEARGGFFGLFIELKRDKRSVASPFQKQWIQDLRDRGYYAQICKGLDETLKLIDSYLELPETEQELYINLN